MSVVDFERVKKKYGLIPFFENEMGSVAKKVAGEVRYSVCPACGTSGNQSGRVSIRGLRWHCFSCSDGGDVIEAAARFFGKSLSEAADYLSGESDKLGPVVRPKPVEPIKKRNMVAVREVIAKLLALNLPIDNGVAAYLEGRCINRELIQEAIDRKIVVTLPSDPNICLRLLLDELGRDLLIESGVWKEGSKAPAIIYRPLLFISHDQCGMELRLIGESKIGSPKAIRIGDPSPALWKGNEHVMITEGFIDMLSAVVMGTERTIFAIPGAGNWKASDQWLKDLSETHVLIALDNDEGSRLAKQNLQGFLISVGAKPKIYAPPEGLKDLNDQLRSFNR
ncbi:toprim domain-containing protein [Rhodoferax antarcticus]|uniref:DNA primase n=1 Tax=Rhodoferax antarcticus ANT.BR TaxID=1111071 RepID=A0A1Q8Y8U1_9BURK|nr:toprim domain-containing protein [Rhodoferax antarcticus]OLP04466.1 hypothetical protein BLL52_4092 [Rhodoferax antarcticus ANT.BR]